MNKNIREILEADLQKVDRLAKLLAEERGDLESRSFDNLASLMTRKADLLADLERGNSKAHDLLAEAGYSLDAAGMQACCKALDEQQGRREVTGTDRLSDSKSLEACFRRLQENLHACREANLVNAAIVHRSRLHSARLLQILQGRPAVPGLYTALGSPGASQGDSRTLGSA